MVIVSERVIGIYKIENLANGKVYVGKSTHIKVRFKSHKYELKNNKHYNSHLQKSWNKYGSKNFTFKILEECDESIIDEREKYYINHFNSCDPYYGYNMQFGGNEGRHTKEAKMKISKALIGRSFSDEHKKNISLAKKGKSVHTEESRKQISIRNSGENNYFYGKKHTEETKRILSIKKTKLDSDKVEEVCELLRLKKHKRNEIAEMFDVCPELITKIGRKYGLISCNMTKEEESDIVEFLKNRNDMMIKDIAIYFNRSRSTISTINNKYNIRTNKRKVVQLDLEGNLIEIYETIKEAKSKTNTTSLINCCINKTGTANGYLWMYYEDYIENGAYKLDKKTVQVRQLATNGRLIKVWNSIKEAATSLDLHATSISATCKGKQKTCGGYMWEYY